MPHAADLRRLALHLAPDNIHANEPHVVAGDGIAWAVVNPVPGLRIRANGVCLGALFEDADWSTPLSGAPDGSFALLRHDERHVELVTDSVASRTVWYVHDDERFLASTSQRALVALLGSFDPQPETVSWMVSAGSLGPELSWDRRLRRVPVGTRLTLDRRAWTLSSSSQRVRFAPVEAPDEQHVERLRQGVFAVCRRLDLADTPNVLTLSGGHDSRSLLVGLAESGRRPACVTWGLSSSLQDPQNDAVIARRLAERFGSSFRYFATDRTGEPLRDVLTRYVKAGEGRSEDLGGYTDGFETWRKLFETGLGAYIRGEAPGWGYYPPINDFVTRSMNLRLTLLEDYPDDHLVHRLGLAAQHLDPRYLREEGESLDTYSSRLTNEFANPTVQAGLLDVKSAYLEPINPLLGRQVLDVAAQLPDRLRHRRAGFERMVGALVPDVPFAEHSADAVSDHYLEWPDLLTELLAELSSERARRIMSPGALDLVIAELDRPASVETAKVRLRGRVRALVPTRVVRLLRPTPRWRLHPREVALRIYLATRANAMLADDAHVLAAGPRTVAAD